MESTDSDCLWLESSPCDEYFTQRFKGIFIYI